MTGNRVMTIQSKFFQSLAGSRVWYVMVLILLAPFRTNAQSGDGAVADNLDWVYMERALEIAAEEDKMILIDVYAEWCPYCQNMQGTVYPDERVEEQVRNYFIPVRINSESNRPLVYLGQDFTEMEFARALQYRSVPTTYFMNKSGEVIGQQPGLLPAGTFADLLRFVGTGSWQKMSFEEFSEQNE
ncbi:MAG: thioredoxin fold domain-containing protein [Balneolaceae bacterium]